MSHTFATDGRSVDQDIVTWGDLLARAHELLSPVCGTTSSAK
jgi:hypothetical protein